MSADGVFYVLALAGAAKLLEGRPLFTGMAMGLGGLLMLYFAGAVWLEAEEAYASQAPLGERAGFLKTFTIALTNPYQLAWWMTAGTGLLGGGYVEALGSGFSVPWAVAGLFSGILIWVVLFPAAWWLRGNGSTPSFHWSRESVRRSSSCSGRSSSSVPSPRCGRARAAGGAHESGGEAWSTAFGDAPAPRDSGFTANVVHSKRHRKNSLEGGPILRDARSRPLRPRTR
ncbi:MAG: hypothetical protein MAG715_01052 [Methanonatronarchaeales archaeon]|nr:hypothetical protein [Methanonatronarchaeales archaeon]